MRFGAVAAALATLVYLNALNNPFVYDDHDTVVANPSLADVTNVRFVLVHSPFRPVVNVSYAIDRAIWGFQPFGFHLTNIVLHALVVFLLWLLMRNAIADARARSGITRMESVTPKKKRREFSSAAPRVVTDDWAAFAGAAIFAVHPLLSEAVAYVSGRSEVLCALFVIASLLCARRAFLGERLWTVGAIAFGVLALLSKENAVALPILLVAYDWLVSPAGRETRRRRLLYVFLPVAILIAIAGVARVLMLSGPVSVQAPILNLLTQSIVIWRYLFMMVVPIGQAIMHSVHRAQSLMDPVGIVALVALAAVIVVAIRLRRHAPVATFGVIWFFAAIAPSSSVISLREGMAEHRVYLAAAGLMFVVSVVAARLLQRQTGKAANPVSGYGFVLVGLIGILGAVTLGRNIVWADPVALWREASVRADGMWEPHYALADTLRQRGDCSAAIPEYEAVVKLRPNHRDAHTNLGICLAQMGRHEDAEQAFRRTLEIEPGFVRGHTNLGALALLNDRPDLARVHYEQALRLDPRNVLARMQLARLYETVFQDYHAAARMCGEARALNPQQPGVVECVQRNQQLAREKDAGKR